MKQINNSEFNNEISYSITVQDYGRGEIQNGNF